MFTDSDIQELILIGSSPTPRVPPQFEGRHGWHRLMCGDAAWESIGRKLDRPELEALIRGLVVLERGPLVGAGSVSPVIPLFRALHQRFATDAPALTEWIIEQRVNEYIPFGSPRYAGARTFEDCRLIDSLESRVAEANQARAQQAAAAKRAERATQRLPHAVRRGDVAAVKAMLANGGRWTPESAGGMSMIELATKEGRTALVTFLSARSDLPEHPTE